jgi:hypothetical protein
MVSPPRVGRQMRMARGSVTHRKTGRPAISTCRRGGPPRSRHAARSEWRRAGVRNPARTPRDHATVRPGPIGRMRSRDTCTLKCGTGAAHL